MKIIFQLMFIILAIIVFSFPSICFSEMKTVTGERCDVYIGNMTNKKELETFKKNVKTESILNGLNKIMDTSNSTIHCVNHAVNNFLEKVVVVSHTQNGRKICDKVKITLDPEVIIKYLSQSECVLNSENNDLLWYWYNHIDLVLCQEFHINPYLSEERSKKINIGLIIETKIPDLDVSLREQIENDEEKKVYDMTVRYQNRYKLVDRRHLKSILEEHKFSSSGLTDSDSVKLGKILNLDIIVLRLIYSNSRVTKVLKVDTGEVLLFKIYETE